MLPLVASFDGGAGPHFAKQNVVSRLRLELSTPALNTFVTLFLKTGGQLQLASAYRYAGQTIPFPNCFLKTAGNPDYSR